LKIPLAEGIQTNRTMRHSRNWAILFVQSVLERLLKKAKSNLSVKRSVELTHNMCQIT